MIFENLRVAWWPQWWYWLQHHLSNCFHDIFNMYFIIWYPHSNFLPLLRPAKKVIPVLPAYQFCALVEMAKPQKSKMHNAWTRTRPFSIFWCKNFRSCYGKDELNTRRLLCVSLTTDRSPKKRLGFSYGDSVYSSGIPSSWGVEEIYDSATGKIARNFNQRMEQVCCLLCE